MPSSGLEFYQTTLKQSRFPLDHFSMSQVVVPSVRMIWRFAKFLFIAPCRDFHRLLYESQELG